MSLLPVVEMRNISKKYGNSLVLTDVSLRLMKGQVLALVGENGAGKSTLIKILTGSVESLSGEIFVEGIRKNYSRPLEAIADGISVIYQELKYLNDLSIAENIYLGRLPLKRKLVNWGKLYSEAKVFMEQVGLNMSPTTAVRDLSVSQKQLVEIAKAISMNAKVIVMDEPTAALNDNECEKLFKIVLELKKRGTAVIYISHRLDEIFRIADDIKILRDGNDIGTWKISEISRGQIVKHMVGREIVDMYPKVTYKLGDVWLEVNKLSNPKIKNVSINVREGEIVSIYGLMGCGVEWLLDSIFGAKGKDSGEIRINGKEVDIKHPSKAIEHGMAYVPAERKTQGIIAIHSIKQNIVTPSIKEFKGKIMMNHKREREAANETKFQLNIIAPSVETLLSSLSGGNQQKVVIGKWVRKQPKIIIVNEPTRGIDVGAKVEVYKILEDMCSRGVAVLMVSSELPEVLALSDRIYVMDEGIIKGEFNKKEASQEILMECIVGG